MKYIHRYVFNVEGTERIIKKIKKYNVKITKGLLYAVEIAEDDPHFNKVSRILNKVDTSTVTAIYSKDEYENAT